MLKQNKHAFLLFIVILFNSCIGKLYNLLEWKNKAHKKRILNYDLNLN